MRPIRRGKPATSVAATIKGKKPTVTLLEPENALQKYLTWHEAEGHSRETQRDYQRCLHPFFSYLKTEQEISDLASVNLSHLRAWLVWLRNTPARNRAGEKAQLKDD